MKQQERTAIISLRIVRMAYFYDYIISFAMQNTVFKRIKGRESGHKKPSLVLPLTAFHTANGIY